MKHLLKILVFASVILPSSMLFAQAEATEVPPISAESGCRALMTNPAAENLENPAAIYIVEPTSDTIYGDTLYVTVDTNNFQINPDGGDHWHLWINGQLATMVYDERLALPIQPGIHQLCAILGDTEHFDLGQPDSMTVTVIAAASGTPTTTPLNAAGNTYAAPRSESRSSTTILIVIVVGGIAAGAIGWWVGRILPKARKN